MRKVQYVPTLSVKFFFETLNQKSASSHSFVRFDQENKLNIYNMVISLELRAKKIFALFGEKIKKPSLSALLK